MTSHFFESYGIFSNDEFDFDGIATVLETQTVACVVSIGVMLILSVAALAMAYVNFSMVILVVNRRMISMDEKLDRAQKMFEKRKFPDELMGILAKNITIPTTMSTTDSTPAFSLPTADGGKGSKRIH